MKYKKSWTQISDLFWRKSAIPSLEKMLGEELKPPPKLNPWEWGEDNIELHTRVSPVPGKYRTDQWAYAREPLEAFGDPEVRTITLCWSAQSTKTMTATMMLLYSIANDPGDAIFVRPSLTMARRFSQKRLIPLIDHNKILSDHKTSDRYDFKKCELVLENMAIFITGANPNQLSGETVRRVFLDETDKYEDYDSDKAEADLVSLAFERMKFVRDSKGVLTSTPTVVSGTIWRWFQKGDQRRYHVPCRHCGAFFKLSWDRVRWPKCDDIERVKKETVVECPHCSGILKERHKSEMILAGRWIPENAGADKKDRSYQLAETYTTTRWGDLAAKFVAANSQREIGRLGPLHNFVNSSLAEPWDPTEHRSRKEDEIKALLDGRKRGELPQAEILAITAFVDSQDTHFWFTVRAWGADCESWLLDEGELPDLDAVKSMIADIKYPAKDGMEYRVNLAMIDSGGHRTREVYEFCRANRGFIPTKGEQKGTAPHRFSKIDKYPGTETPIPGGIRLLLINTSFYKNDLAAKIELGGKARGAFHVFGNVVQKDEILNPMGIEGISESYIRHMTAEYRDEKGIWRKPSGKRNDLWDCETGCFCAADLLRVGARKKPIVYKSKEPPKKNEPEPEKKKEPVATPKNPYLSEGPMAENPYIRR